MARFGRADVDLVEGSARFEDQTHTLTPLEQRVLAYLHARRGQLVGRDELEREVWGFRAGVKTKAVPVGIRRLRAKLGKDAIHTVHGKGWRVDPEPTGEPPERRIQVPRPRARLFGRTDELHRIETLLDESPAVFLTGPPGVGKTRLATEVTRRWASQTLSIATPGQTTVADVWRALGDALGVDGRPEPVLRVLSGMTRPLVLLDAVEALPDLETLLDALMTHLPQGRCLLTGRRLLRLPGTAVFTVSPFDRDTGRAFLVERLREHHSHPEAEGARLDALVEAVDGLPGALELYAAQAILGLGPVLEALRKQGVSRDLTQGLTRSWTLLSNEARSGLLTLAVFRGVFSVEAGLALCDASVLTELRTSSLLSLADHGLHLLEVVRAFATAQVDDHGARARGRSWVLDRGERWVGELHTSPRRAQTELQQWYGTFVAIMNEGPPADASRAAWLLTESARLAEQQAIDLDTLDAVTQRTTDPALRTRLRVAAARVGRRLGLAPLGILDRLQGMHTPEALYIRAQTMGSLGDFPAAAEQLRRLAEGTEDPWISVLAASRLASQTLAPHVDDDELDGLLEQALQRSEDLGLLSAQVAVLSALAVRRAATRGVTAALPVFRRALDLAHRERLDRQSMSLHGLLGSALFPEDLPGAMAAFAQASERASQLGLNPLTLSYSLNQAQIAFLLDDPETALSALANLDDARPFKAVFAYGTVILGAALLSAGRHEEARVALALLDRSPLPQGFGMPAAVVHAWVDVLSAEDRVQRLDARDRQELTKLLRTVDPLLALDTNGVLRGAVARVRRKLAPAGRESRH